VKDLPIQARLFVGGVLAGVLRAGMRPYDICVRYAGNEFIAAVFRHDGDTCETLLANADSRMYRDKTRRKREIAGAHQADEHARGTAPGRLSDGDLKRAATGVL
jgi:hypothetical protein